MRMTCKKLVPIREMESGTAPDKFFVGLDNARLRKITLSVCVYLNMGQHRRIRQVDQMLE